MDVSASRTGVLAYGTARQVQRKFVWLGPDGKKSDAVSDLGVWGEARISPDGHSLVARRSESGRVDVWVIGLTRGAHQKLTFSGNASNTPIWAPDGREIIYAISGKGLFRRLVDGAGEPELLIPSTTLIGAGDWSDDGKFLLYGTVTPAPTLTVALLAIPFDAGSAGKPIPYLKIATTTGNSLPRFSPGLKNPRRVAYQSDESGSMQVYIRDFPDAQGQRQVSTNGGQRPVWSHDGSELFYIGAGNKVMRVSLSVPGGGFVLGKPEPLFDAPANYFAFDVSPDARRFLFSVPDDQNHRLEVITLVQNWQGALKK
jgi:Tol biopolymer transport system component